MRPEVVYRGRQLHSSILWLVLAVFLGGSPLAVYFTMPDPTPATLVLAIVLGAPLFAMSLVDLGRSSGLILNPATRQLKYIEGFFARRRAKVYSYDQVRGVQLHRHLAQGTKGAPDAQWSLRIEVGPKESILLEEWSYKEAARRARHLGATFGVQPRIDGEPLYVEAVAVPRPGTGRSLLTPLVFYGLGALVLVMAILYVCLRILAD